MTKIKKILNRILIHMWGSAMIRATLSILIVSATYAVLAAIFNQKYSNIDLLIFVAVYILFRQFYLEFKIEEFIEKKEN